MSNVRRSARLAAKKETVPLIIRIAKPKVKNIDLEHVPLKVNVPKLVDYDSDDSDRTVSDIVKPITKIQHVKPVEAVEPVSDIKKEDPCNGKTRQAVKTMFTTEYPMSPLKPEVKIKKDTVIAEDFAFYIIDNNSSVSTTDFEEIDGSKSLAYLVEPSLLTKAKRSDQNGKECLICKRTKFINTVKNYLNIIENSIDNFKTSLIIEMFEFFDKNFDYMNTKEFDSNKRFVLVIHSKAVSLQEELDHKIKHTNPQYINDITMFNNAKKLLQRVHTKCHLYGMDKFVTDDPIYKKFLATFIDQYVQL